MTFVICFYIFYRNEANCSLFGVMLCLERKFNSFEKSIKRTNGLERCVHVI